MIFIFTYPPDLYAVCSASMLAATRAVVMRLHIIEEVRTFSMNFAPQHLSKPH